MILKRKNPQANPNNALQIRAIDGICCGDVDKAIVCLYNLTIDTSSVATASKISIGSVTRNFGISIDLTTDAGADLLIEHIHKALADAGYTQDGVSYTRSGDNLTLNVFYSQVSFDWLESAANAFTKDECKVVGNFKSKVCGAELVHTVEGDYVVITPTSMEVINNMKVNDGTADRFDGQLDASTDAASGNSDTKNNAVYLSIAAFSYGADTTTFTVIISSNDCGDIEIQFTITLP